ncbi:hypothetical protein D9611_007070 [Ephemerocybe angulata]|uniref:Enoyl reductase (ER) domain-containing protein n=1 Tax=Ephemerocybe angulata TaxID=980116 RepID=A0A8H5EWM6_9AGAR|nr:hypothetical protein D9611_007070 [Tulosesus angulatus]
MPCENISAAVLYPGSGRDLRVEDRDIWGPNPTEVQIAVAATGLCGSDLHYYAHGRNGDFMVKQHIVLGHEAAGVVTAVGSDVLEGIRVGDRVAIEAGIYCRQCSFCEKKRYNLCKSMKFCSSASVFPHFDGTLRERMNHPAFVVHPLPDGCSFEQASLAEPLSVLLHASRRAELSAGQTVLVFGAGTIGLLACALAKARGASKIVVVDINPTRLEFAKHYGFASETFCLPPPSPPSAAEAASSASSCCSHGQQSRPPPTPQQLSAEQKKQLDDQMRRTKDNVAGILEHFGHRDGFDLVYECTGAEPVIQMSIFAAATGGKVMLIGMGARNVTLPLSSAACREVDILGSFRYCNTYPEALALLASGELENVERLVTHRFPLSETKRAFDMMMRGVDDEGNMVLKVMVGSGKAC